MINLFALQAAPRDSPLDIVQVLIFIATAMGVLIAFFVALWGLRQWKYGGSVLKVEYMVGLTNGKEMLTAPVSEYRNPVVLKGRLTQRIEGPSVDVAVVTVRNLGRTPATILSPALSFSARISEDVEVTGVLIDDGNGETDYRVRIEAHDARVFTFNLRPMVEEALKDIRHQQPEGTVSDVHVRAVVKSGTGKKRFSPRRVRLPKRLWWADARWKVDMPVLGRKLTHVEQLASDHLVRNVNLYEQLLAMEDAVRVFEDGDLGLMLTRVQSVIGPGNAIAFGMGATRLIGVEKMMTHQST